MGVYTLTGAGCKKDFNKGMLPVVHMRGYIEESNKVKHHDLEQILRLLVREKSSKQL